MLAEIILSHPAYSTKLPESFLSDSLELLFEIQLRLSLKSSTHNLIYQHYSTSVVHSKAFPRKTFAIYGISSVQELINFENSCGSLKAANILE